MEVEYHINIPEPLTKKLRKLAELSGYPCEIHYLEDMVAGMIAVASIPETKLIKTEQLMDIMNKESA